MTKSMRPWVHKGNVQAGNMLVADAGFTCIHEGRVCEVKADADGLYIDCLGPDEEKSDHNNGEFDYCERHYLEGQLDAHGCYVGLTKRW